MYLKKVIKYLKQYMVQIIKNCQNFTKKLSNNIIVENVHWIKKNIMEQKNNPIEEVLLQENQTYDEIIH